MTIPDIPTMLFVGGWALAQLWLFIVAPMIGAALASLLYNAIRTPAHLISAKTAEQALDSEQAARA